MSSGRDCDQCRFEAVRAEVVDSGRDFAADLPGAFRFDRKVWPSTAWRTSPIVAK
jgi:hypothetical protein